MIERHSRTAAVAKRNLRKSNKKRLPPDPEECNDARAAYADAAIKAFRDITHVDRQDAIGDLVGNLMHLCDRDATLGSFEDGLARAYRHYEQETAPDEEYLQD